MSNISKPLQLRADRPVESDRYATLAALDEILKRLQCPYMLVGATARDILLYNVFGQQVLRATRDVDIGISIDSWGRFQGKRVVFPSGFVVGWGLMMRSWNVRKG